MSLLDGPSVSEVDLAFAISATATDADETFSRIKETTKYIVNKYGTDKIHHGLLVFGNAPSRVRDFRRDAFTREEVIRLLDSVPRSSTGDMLKMTLCYEDSLTWCILDILNAPVS